MPIATRKRPPNARKKLRAGKSGVRLLTIDEVPESFPIRYGAKLSGLPDMKHNSWKGASRATAWLGEKIGASIPENLKIDGLTLCYREANAFLVAFDLFTKKEMDLEWLDREAPVKAFRQELRKSSGVVIPPENTSVVSSACASGHIALGNALQKIRSGVWKRAIVAAVELDSHPLQMMSLFLLGALSTGFEDPTKASRPFAKNRNGFVKGESASVVLLESKEAMEERGAQAYAQLLGQSNTTDAFRLTDGRPDGASLARAMKLALADAKIAAGDVGYLKAHATSTPSGDLVEIEAIRRIFGPAAKTLPINSLKSLLGHSTAAAGLMEFVVSTLMMRNQFLSPNLNLEEIDPKLDPGTLNLVGSVSRDVAFSHALLNSSGFGGQNACLVLKSTH